MLTHVMSHSLPSIVSGVWTAVSPCKVKEGDLWCSCSWLAAGGMPMISNALANVLYVISQDLEATQICW